MQMSKTAFLGISNAWHVRKQFSVVIKFRPARLCENVYFESLKSSAFIRNVVLGKRVENSSSSQRRPYESFCEKNQNLTLLKWLVPKNNVS